MKTLIIASIALSLVGCAELRPVSVPVAVEHTSHITQHFGPDRTNYGWNTFSVGLKWRIGGTSIVVSDGYSPEKLDGHHEIFTARFEHEFRLGN